MQRRGTWWKGAVCAAAVGGCFSNPEDDPWIDPGGEAGQTSAGSSGNAGTGPSAGAGGSGVAGQAGAGGSGVAGRAGAGGSGVAGQAGAGGSGVAGQGATGGSGGGQSGSGGTGGPCSSVPPCGGDITGTWTVASSCLDVRGVLDVSGLGLGCSSAPLTGSRVVAGTFVANANGTYVDNTTTSGEERIELPEACLSVSGTLVTCERVAPVFAAVYGYDSVTCTTDADGDGCLCDAVFEQTAGMGLLSLDPADSGTYVSSGDVVTLHDAFGASVDYLYCVAGEQLTLLPRTTATGTPRGRIVLVQP
jgi:hypothetical protein